MKKFIISLIALFCFATPATANLQDDFNSTSAYLRSINLPVNDVQARTCNSNIILSSGMNECEYFNSRPGLVVQAFATPNNVVINSKWFPILEARPQGEIVAVIRLHELLHQIQGVHMDPNPLEEGLVEAIAFDLAKPYLVWKFGKVKKSTITPFENSGYYSEVQAIRYMSKKATGKPWKSPEAFAWRVSMLLRSHDERAAEWLKVVNDN